MPENTPDCVARRLKIDICDHHVNVTVGVQLTHATMQRDELPNGWFR